MLGVSIQEAWDEIQTLLDANVLFERDGGLAHVRPYTEFEAYSLRASKWSHYTCRRFAVRQMNAAGDEAAAREARQERLREAAPEQIFQFGGERCLPAENSTESETVLRAKYADWADEKRLDILPLELFGGALTGLV